MRLQSACEGVIGRFVSKVPVKCILGPFQGACEELCLLVVVYRDALRHLLLISLSMWLNGEHFAWSVAIIPLECTDKGRVRSISYNGCYFADR